MVTLILKRPYPRCYSLTGRKRDGKSLIKWPVNFMAGCARSPHRATHPWDAVVQRKGIWHCWKTQDKCYQRSWGDAQGRVPCPLSQEYQQKSKKSFLTFFYLLPRVWDETLTLPRQLYTLQVVLQDHTYPYHPYQRLVDVPEAKWADWFCTRAMRQGQTLTQIIYLQFSWQRTYQSV